MLVYLAAIEGKKEKSKFKALHRKYEKLMFYIAYRILNNEKDAEDAVQEAFLSIAKNFSKISEIECPKTRNYIVTIVENKALDIYRSKARMTSVSTDELPGASEDVMQEQSGLVSAMARLPVRYRQVIVMKYSCGYKTGEIAKMLGLSSENTRKLIYRAKERLRDELKKEGVEV